MRHHLLSLTVLAVLLLAACPLLAAPPAGRGTSPAASLMLRPVTAASESCNADAAPHEFAPGPAAAPISLWPLETQQVLARVTGGRRDHTQRAPLSAERARVMLQSLTVPGWGQYTEGRHGAARVFALIDVGIWTSFVAFQVQEHLRTESALKTASISAGIDLHDRSEEYRRIVGSFPNSGDYNQLVVYRDAANLYYNDPVAYRAYIAQHQITGSGAWAWTDPTSYGRYQDQRKSAQRAGLRANTALACALANRLISAVHAAGSSGGLTSAGHGVGLRLEPDVTHGPVAVRLALQTGF